MKQQRGQGRCTRQQPTVTQLEKDLTSLLLKQAIQDSARIRAYKNISSIEKGVDGAISSDDRDITARWLVHLSKEFRFHPETCCTAISILDRFLSVIKAHRKYLKCIGVSCLYLAAKTLEEDEVIPDILSFIHESQCGNSVSEVSRMEPKILEKLQWAIVTVTPLDVIQNLHAQLLLTFPDFLSDLSVPVSVSEQLGVLTRKLHACLCYHSLLQFSPSTIAVALISLELEQCSRRWFYFTSFLQSKIQVDTIELINCREQISGYLSISRLSRRHPYYLKPVAYTGNGRLPAKATKRKREHLDSTSSIDDEDDVYDAIKRLYNDEPCNTASTCAMQVGQEPTTRNMTVQCVAN